MNTTKIALGILNDKANLITFRKGEVLDAINNKLCLNTHDRVKSEAFDRFLLSASPGDDYNDQSFLYYLPPVMEIRRRKIFLSKNEKIVLTITSAISQLDHS